MMTGLARTVVLAAAGVALVVVQVSLYAADDSIQANTDAV